MSGSTRITSVATSLGSCCEILGGTVIFGQPIKTVMWMIPDMTRKIIQRFVLLVIFTVVVVGESVMRRWREMFMHSDAPPITPA
jgi:hypothetical protein